MKRNVLLIFLILFCSLVKGQNVEGHIIKVDGDKIYVSLHHPSISVSDVLSVYDNDSSNTEAVALIEITAIPGAYSVGRVLSDASAPLAKEMIVRKDGSSPPVIAPVSIPPQEESTPVSEPVFVPQDNQVPPVNENESTPANLEDTPASPGNYLPPANNNNDEKASVVIAPAEVQFPDGVNNMIVGATGESGYVGSYVSAALTKQLKKCDKIRLLDPSVMQELGLRARYMVKVTMQKPDVAIDVDNSVSLGGLLGVAQNAANNYGGRKGQQQATQIQQMRQVAPENVSKSQVVVSVNAIAEIIDSQTGEILLTTDPVTGTHSGTPQIGIDLPAAVGTQTSQYDPYSQPQTNNGIQINKGAVFSQTVTGKAIEKAIMQIGKELVNYFNNQLNN